jgi:hypothetical protein
MEIGEDDIVIVELIDYFAGFLDGFDDEYNLIVEAVDLIDLDAL